VGAWDLEGKGEKTGENHDTRPPAPPQSDPTPRPGPPNQKDSLPTPKRGPDPPNQGGDTNRRRTRGVTALAAKKQHQAVDFVSGGTMENDDAR